MNEDIEYVIDDLALSLGTDAPFFRTEKNRLYLSGIEIAGGIAVGLVSSYLIGVYKGAKKRLGEQGEKDGAALVDVAISKLKDVVRRIIAARNSERANEELALARSELLLVGFIEVTPLIEKSDASTSLDEVKGFLIEAGYPSDLIVVRAEQYVGRISAEIDNK